VRRNQNEAAAPAAGAAVPIKRPVSELEVGDARRRRELASAKPDLEITKQFGGVFREGVTANRSPRFDGSFGHGRIDPQV
jgi:hypothetical protein